MVGKFSRYCTSSWLSRSVQRTVIHELHYIPAHQRVNASWWMINGSCLSSGSAAQAGLGGQQSRRAGRAAVRHAHQPVQEHLQRAAHCRQGWQPASTQHPAHATGTPGTPYMHNPPDQFLMPCAVHCTACLLPLLRLINYECHLGCALTTPVEAACDKMQLIVQGHPHVGTSQVCELHMVTLHGTGQERRLPTLHFLCCFVCGSH